MGVSAFWKSKFVGKAVPSYRIIHFALSKKRRDGY